MPGAQCDYEVVSVAMNTSIGNQVITGNCGGKIPKAARIIATRGVTLGTGITGAMLSESLTDGTNHRIASCMSEHGALVATFNNGRRTATDALVHVLDTATQAIDGSASFVSFTADSITISVDDAPSTAVQLLVFLFYGDTLLAKVDTVATSATQDVEVTSPSVGFRPRVLFCIAGIGGFATNSANARFSHGFAVLNDDGSVQAQAGQTLGERDLPTTNTGCGNAFRSDSVTQRFAISAAGTLTDESRQQVTLGTADGFKVTTRGGAFGINIGYLALYTGSLRAWVGIASIDTSSATNQAVTGPGFRPRAVFAMGSLQATININVSDTQAAHLGAGGAITGSALAATYQSTDGAITSSTRCRSSAVLCMVEADGGGADWSCTLASMDPTGFTVTVGTASAANRQTAFLALEAGSAPGWLDARSGHRWRRQLARM